MRGHSSREVARLLGLSVPQVRGWARDDIIAPERGPRGELRFSFRDLVLLRTARELLAVRVSAGRVKRALRQLRAQLPAGRSLAGVRVTADGDRVLVRDGATLWHPESGQTILDFAAKDAAACVAPLTGETARAAVSADTIYEQACDLEDGSPEQAREAYRRVLERDPDHYGANLNLGRILHESRDLVGAERHYRRALAARPADAGALFNFGVALEDQGRDEEALTTYEASLARDASRADSHRNAARLCEKLGRREQALRHLGAARRLTRSKP